MSSPPSINLKLYSGATHHFHKIGSMDLPQQPTSNYNPESRVIVPNGSYMVSSVTTHFPIPSLPPYDTKSYNFNHLSSGFLFSVGQAFNNNYTAVFEKNSVKIFISTEVNINALRPPIIQGHRNAPPQPLYSVSLSTHPPSIHKANAIINVSSIRDHIAFYRGAYYLQQFSSGAKQLKMVFFNLGLN